MGARKRQLGRVGRAKMRFQVGLLFCIDQSDVRSGGRSPMGARARTRLEEFGYHRRLGLDGFGSVEACRHRNLRRRRRRRPGAICH